MDGDQAVLGLGVIPRGFGYSGRDLSLPTSGLATSSSTAAAINQDDVPRTTGPVTGTETGTRDWRRDTGAGTTIPSGTEDHRNYHRPNYSNKNWNLQQHRPATGQPRSRTLSQMLVYSPSELAQAGGDPSQYPSQSHWPPNQGHRQQGQGQYQYQYQYQGPYHHQLGQQHVLLAGAVSPSKSQFQSHPRLNANTHAHAHAHSPQQAHHQPYHHRHTSQPPRLPPLAPSLSSFSSFPSFSCSSLHSVSTSPPDPFQSPDGDTSDTSNNYFLSFSAASPAPTTTNAVAAVPRFPASTDEIVSPISETRSSTPAFRSFDHPGSEPTTVSATGAAAYSPAAPSSTLFPAPTTTLRRQPTSDSSARASLFDDRDFELSLGVTNGAEHPSSSGSLFPSAAVTSAVAQDVAHLTDERSDDWFRFTAPESTTSKHTNSFAEAHQGMSVVMTANGPSVPEQQLQQQFQPQQEELQQQGGQFTAASSSFTPLPPIRRTSTFDVLRKIDYDSDSTSEPIEKDSTPVSMLPGPPSPVQQPGNGQFSPAQDASRASPHNLGQPQPQQTPDLSLPDQSRSAIPQRPEGLIAAGPANVAGQAGIPQHPITPMHPHSMVMGRGGPAGQPVAHGQMMVNGQGTILAGGRQWTVQESHLTEPLNPSNRNRSANSPQTYTAYDKETEGEGAPPHLGVGSSQPVQTRPRNLSNTAPPTAATRFPALFPHPSTEQPPFPRNPGQAPLSQLHLMHRQNGNPGRRDSFDDRSLAKELDVRVDQVSVSSATTEDVNDKQRRGSGSLFSLGHRRNPSNTTAAQSAPPDGTSEKKKNLFAAVTGMVHSQPKPKSNLGPTRTQPPEQSDQVPLQNPGDHVAGKKKLSELKGMIKGVGNAKEGVKDDEPVKVETVYEARESMQSPPRNFAVPQGLQGAQGHPIPFGLTSQPGLFDSQAQAHSPVPVASMQPHPSQMRPPGAASPSPFTVPGRASTSGPPPNQHQQAKGDDNVKKSSGGGFLGGLFGKQGNKTKEPKPQSPQQIPPSVQRPAQPPTQAGYLPFRPGQMQLPGQQLGPHPMFAGQPPIQRSPPGQTPSPVMFHDPTLPSPAVQTAQAVTMRRPSEITVSSSIQSGSRPGIPSPRPSQTGFQNDGGIAPSRTSPRLSDDSPLEKPAIGKLSAIPRFSPNRKPVGSGNPRGDGPFMTSAVSSAAMGRTGSPSPGPGQQRAPSQLSNVKQSPPMGSSGGLNDIHQASLPSPEPSPVHSQSNHSSSSRLQGDQFSRDSSDTRNSGQGLGVFPNGLGPSGTPNAQRPGGAPNGLTWGPNGVRPSVPPLASPSAAARAQPPRAPSSPVPSMDQSKLSKFFGAYDGGKPAAHPQANKEKSAASKFLGAFKRSSKQGEDASSQSRPQTSPQVPQQGIRPGGFGPSPSGGMPNSGGVPPSSGNPVRWPQQLAQHGQPTPAQQMQAGRGQPGQMPPGMPTLAQAGRGQIPPGMMMQGGRGQMSPPMLAGAGPLPPHMQRPTSTKKQGNEVQYDQVPIPRGYEAVHGYGPGGMLAFSPYNAGRPGPPPIQYAQYPPALPPGFQQGQWDPRMTPFPQAGLPPNAAPRTTPISPQGVPHSFAFQGTPQVPSQTQNPPVQTLQSAPNQSQQPPQFNQSSPTHQQSGELSPPGQAQIPIQSPQNAQLQQRQPYEQGIQRGPSPGSQAQPYSWSGTPQNQQSPAASIQEHNSPTPNLAPQSSVRDVSSTDSPTTNGISTPQSQHTAATAPSQPSQPVQANPNRQTSPVNQVVDLSTQIAAAPSYGQPEATRASSSTPSSTTTAASGALRSQDAVRLTSRMSVSQHATRSNASFGSDKPADRNLTVSPEPPGPRHGPIHQVSEQNLNVHVERANSHARYGSDDIYDATPRLGTSTPRQGQGEDQAHENTKYAGSEKGRILANGAGAAVVAAPVVTEDNMSFLDGPDDSEPDENSNPKPAGEESKEETISPPQRTATMNLEPEEKILVDLPVELAAVHDDDDGIPMMTATSYPGQEWNPYGAGEFGDWE
ncbi:hypothetical protein F5Y03DRAFT_309495 [Xylaria venustula]|nr:hypothetical protein F5Y03DRAFT_309495 [Xylaria venustula]